MKTPQQWQEELAGETSLESIKQIQDDARRDGYVKACRILEFYLWFEGKKAPNKDPMWQPYIDLRTLIHQLDTPGKEFVWEWERLREN